VHTALGVAPTAARSVSSSSVGGSAIELVTQALQHVALMQSLHTKDAAKMS
jgi:hypothetical protein